MSAAFRLLAIEGTHEQKALPLLDKEQPARQIGGVDVQDRRRLKPKGR